MQLTIDIKRYIMGLGGEKFTQRLEKLSEGTMIMISKIAKYSKKHFYRALNLVDIMDSEEEIVEELKIMMAELNI